MELYATLMKMFYAEKCSKREFAEKHELSHFWFTDFSNLENKRRVLRPKTIGILYTNLGINPKLCYDYNKFVLENEES